MTTSINFTQFNPFKGMPAAEAVQAAKVAAETIDMDPQARATLRQMIVRVETAINAVRNREQAAGRLVHQMTTSQQQAHALAAQYGLDMPPSTLGPAQTELMAHLEVLEDLKKRKAREAEAASTLVSAIDTEQRATADLLRAFNFLLPHQQTREDKSADVDDPVINPHDKDASGLIWNSHSDFYEMIGLLLGALQEQWLSKYQDAMKVYLDFYEKFSDAMDLIEVGKGGNGNVLVDFKEMKAAMEKVLEEFGLKELASFDTKEQADAWVKSLGIPGLEAVQEGGKFVVKIDMGPIDDIFKTLGDPPPDRVSWDPARYNAWVASKDGNVEQIKHTSKVLAEKLSEVRQKFDDIVKLLSSTIDKINQADMSFVNGI